MDALDKLSVILRQHIWCVIAFAALLLLTVITFWLGGKGNEIVSYASFAAAVLSIVLAVIVIVYTFFQTNRSEQNISEMRRLIFEGQRIIAEKTGEVKESTTEISQILQTLTGAKPSLVSKPGVPPATETLPFDISHAHHLCLLILYCAVESCKHQKPISPREIVVLIFPGIVDLPHTKSFMEGVAVGVLLGFECLSEPNSLIMDVVRVLPGPKEHLKAHIKSVPPGLEEHISQEIKRRLELPITPKGNRPIEACVQSIDAYFEAA